MGNRLDEDVIFYEEKSDRHKLSEDGFCNNCNDFHTDCFCIGFWVRRSATFHKMLKQKPSYSDREKSGEALDNILNKIKNVPDILSVLDDINFLKNYLSNN